MKKCLDSGDIVQLTKQTNRSLTAPADFSRCAEKGINDDEDHH